MENNNDCPCKGCTEETGRTIGCHGTCSKYTGWNSLHIAAKARDKMIIMKMRSADDDKMRRIAHVRRLSKNHHL